jgi:hypothetical protein
MAAAARASHSSHGGTKAYLKIELKDGAQRRRSGGQRSLTSIFG